MKVTTVSASVRYSKALGDGSHKTVELSANQGSKHHVRRQSKLK
jgi:hypothetical protein